MVFLKHVIGISKMSNLIIDNSKHFEDRGSIYTIYRADMCDVSFVQDKITKSYEGVIRGFHGDNKTYKLISCLHGKIRLVTYDVDNDIKEEYILDGDDTKSVSVLVPPRVLNAHQCLTTSCIFHYKWSEYYTSPEDQWSVNYNDDCINPEWNTDIIRYDFPGAISDRDKNAPSLKDFKKCLNKT